MIYPYVLYYIFHFLFIKYAIYSYYFYNTIFIWYNFDVYFIINYLENMPLKTSLMVPLKTTP
jgi:hypothetical protein